MGDENFRFDAGWHHFVGVPELEGIHRGGNLSESDTMVMVQRAIRCSEAG